MEFDVILANGTVFDGSGTDAIYCDIGIKGDQITNMGDLSSATAKQVVDAAGLTICPGFIDVHSHSDAYLLLEPSAASKVYQGVTTEICGNCGASAAPLNGDYRMPSDWMAQLEAMEHESRERAPSAPRTARQSVPAHGSTAPAPWSTVAEYRQRFEEARPAINTALLIGHNTLHAGICGYEPRAATSAEMKKMVHALDEAFEQGAIGLSSGLAYAPGSAVPREELIQLAQVAARHDRIYTTHMRSESGQLLEAIDEAIDIASRSGARLQISHLKASGSGNWHKLESAFRKIRAARKNLSIGSDRYPYTASCTDLDIVLPEWASHGGRDVILGRIRDAETRQRIRNELMKEPPDRWKTVMIGSTTFERFKGKYLTEAAEQLNMNPVDAILHLIDSDDLLTGGIFFGMSEENMWRVLAEPYVSIGSDGSLRAPWGPLSRDHPHPRAYGSHTRFLRAALDGETVPLPEAVFKMTGLAADQFNLPRRGRLREGNFADLIVFDPERLRENTTYADPHQLSDGMVHVFVNGRQCLKEGTHTESRGGIFLAGN